jgi:hypothetical protein
MKNKIGIIEGEEGRIYTMSVGTSTPVSLPQEVIEDLVAEGMDREEAENIKTKGVSVRIMRAKHMETDVAVDDTTKDLINRIRDKK